MTQPAPPPTPAQPAAPRPVAPPPNLRVQAVDFALQLATANRTPSLQSATDSRTLINNAEAIYEFISRK